MGNAFSSTNKDVRRMDETQVSTTSRKNTWNYLRHICSLCDKHTGEEPTRDIELIERGSNRAPGWQGTSYQTFEDFLRKAIKQSKRRKYKDADTLEDDLYELYMLDERQQGFSTKASLKAYKDFLKNPFKDAGAPVNIKWSESMG